ncbi:MAG: 30S ribosomal protein S27e [Nanoarchaeota archaeon]
MDNSKKKSGFIKIKCHKCGNEQVIFGRASTKVYCLNKDCNELIAVPRGGKAAVSAEILELY